MPREWDEIKDIHLPEIGLTLAELRQKLEENQQQLKAIKRAHDAYAHAYTKEERAVAYAQSLLHSPEEANAYDAILISADKFPEYVKPLASKDDGTDDDTFETHLIEARLEATKMFQDAAKQSQKITDSFLDTAAFIGQNAKPVLGAAYRLLKPVAAVLSAVHTTLSPALDFFKLNKGRPRKSKKP